MEPKTRTLSFADAPMFDRVMSDEDVCREVIEVVLGVEVGKVVYHNVEQTIEPTLDGRGVRLDAYLVGNEAVYDVEMQSYDRMCIDKRFRYYQSSIDAGLLRKGEDYDLLPDSFIIFVCADDPYKKGLPRYDFERVCAEDPELVSECGSHWIVLNARAYQDVENDRLRSLLQYVHNGVVGADPLVQLINSKVNEANQDRRWVDQVFSVMTVEEDAAMQVRIAQRVYSKKGLEEGIKKGLKKGLDEGREKGLKEGRKETEKRYGLLVSRLIAEDRLDDLKRVADDPSLLEGFYKEFGI